MIKFENVVLPSTEQWMAIITGMRNPLASWKRSDSYVQFESPHDMSGENFVIGPNDHDLMMRLAKAGPVHAKYRRFIIVYVDITAPLYWWKEFDTYRTGVAPNPMDIEMNSCSTMHKIHAKEFTLEDFSCEHLWPRNVERLKQIIGDLNDLRDIYLRPEKHNFGRELEKKDVWWQMIQLLPSSYNQKRTIKTNYEALSHMYKDRHNHKQDEWSEHDEVDLRKLSKVLGEDGMTVQAPKKIIGLCDWIKTLPYSEIITLED